MAKVLIIDDDYDLAHTVANSLKKELFSVEIAKTGAQGIERATNEVFGLIILDILLPDVDGFTICRQLRLLNNCVPVLMLTGKDSLDDRITGLDSGADDYLTKPFSTRELSARVRALLRRPIVSHTNELRAGNVTADLVSHSISVNDNRVKVLPIDYALLCFLMAHPNEIHSVENLLANVWSVEQHPTENSLRLAIKRLRKVIDEDGTPSIIETVSKAGYRLRNRQSP